MNEDRAELIELGAEAIRDALDLAECGGDTRLHAANPIWGDRAADPEDHDSWVEYAAARVADALLAPRADGARLREENARLIVERDAAVDRNLALGEENRQAAELLRQVMKHPTIAFPGVQDYNLVTGEPYPTEPPTPWWTEARAWLSRKESGDG